jgi:hypothetical protein
MSLHEIGTRVASTAGPPLLNAMIVLEMVI